jgi:nucleoside phosphorylase
MQPTPQKADVLIVTATNMETTAVLAVLREELGNNFKSEWRFIGTETYRDLGEIGGARTFLVQSEMGSGGPGESLQTVDESIRALEPTAVIMVGIAFGIEPGRQRIGEVLVAKQLIPYELQRVGTGPQGELDIILRGNRPYAAPRLVKMFRGISLEWQSLSGVPVSVGPVLSGAKLIDHQGFRTQLQTLAPAAIGGEMEGEGLYVAAERHKVDWILVKAICDWADGHKAQNKDQHQQEAARNAAQFVVYVASKGGLAPIREQPNATDLRHQLNQLFDDAQLEAFCLDYYPEVYDRFGRGMRKDEKITLLLDNSRRTGYDALLNALRRWQDG